MAKQEYDNTNSGYLYTNEDKDKPDANPKWPDSKGTLNVNGVEYWLSAWRSKDRNGKGYLSIKITKKEPRGGAQTRRKENQAPAPAQAELDDDIPF